MKEILPFSLSFKLLLNRKVTVKAVSFFCWRSNFAVVINITQISH